MKSCKMSKAKYYYLHPASEHAKERNSQFNKADGAIKKNWLVALQRPVPR